MRNFKKIALLTLSSFLLLGSTAVLASNGDFYNLNGELYKTSSEVLSKKIEINTVLSNTSKYAMRLNEKIYSLSTIAIAYKEHGNSFLDNLGKYPEITGSTDDFIIIDIY